MSLLRKFRLRYVFIGLASIAVAITSVTSFLGLGESSGGGESPALRDLPPPRIVEFALSTPAQLDATADPKGGTPVSVVASQDIVVAAKVQGVKELVVAVYECGACPTKTFSARPDETGAVLVPVRLPEADKIYVVEGIGLVEDRQILGWDGDYYNQRPAVGGAQGFRVITTKP